MASGERDELHATCAEQYLRSHQKRIGPLLRKAPKGSVDVEIGSGGGVSICIPIATAADFTSAIVNSPVVVAGVTRSAKHIATGMTVQKPEPLLPKAHCHVSDTGQRSPQAG